MYQNKSGQCQVSFFRIGKTLLTGKAGLKPAAPWPAKNCSCMRVFLPVAVDEKEARWLWEVKLGGALVGLVVWSVGGADAGGTSGGAGWWLVGPNACWFPLHPQIHLSPKGWRPSTDSPSCILRGKKWAHGPCVHLAFWQASNEVHGGADDMKDDLERWENFAVPRSNTALNRGRSTQAHLRTELWT